MYTGCDNNCVFFMFFFPDSLILWCDNIFVISLASNLLFHAGTKHVEIDYHFVHEKMVLKEIVVYFISSKDQIVDLFTKHREDAFDIRFDFNISPNYM